MLAGSDQPHLNLTVTDGHQPDIAAVGPNVRTDLPADDVENDVSKRFVRVVGLSRMPLLR